MQMKTSPDHRSAADVELVLLAAESLLRDPPPKSEADRKAYRAQLLDMEGELNRLDVNGPAAERILRSLAKLAGARGDHKGSIQAWHRVLEIVQKLFDEANLALGVAHARLADLEVAKDHIEKVSPQGRTAVGYEKERRAIEVRISINKSISIAETLVEMAENGGDVAQAEKLITSALTLSGLPYRKDAKVHSLLKEAFSVISKMHRPTISEEKQDILTNYIAMRQPLRDATRGAKIIFCSGFMWTGSGAVTDYLVDHPDVHIAFQGRELTIFNYLNTLLGIFDSPSGKIGPRELMSLFLGPVSGLLADRNRIYPRRNSSLFKAQWDASSDISKQLQVCYSLVVQLTEIQACRDVDLHQKLLVVLMEFANNLLDSFSVEGKKQVLLNNCIFGYHVREISLFRDAVMVSVRRDPRDQYISQYYEMPPTDVPTVDRFVKSGRSRLMHYDRTLSVLRLDDRVIEIWFEDFVEDERARQRLMDRLSLASCGSHSMGMFDPAKSSKNIGLYKSFHNKVAIRSIEAGLKEYLYPGRRP